MILADKPMKTELTKKKFIAIASGISVIVLLGVYFILFRPLISKLGLSRKEYKKFEVSVLQAYDAIGSLKRQELNRELLSEGNISSAIEELIKNSKSKGINFIALTPKQIKSQQALYEILPIEIELNATYAALSDFLGRLDDLNGSIVFVRKFNIALNKVSPKNFTVKLFLDMCIFK